MDGKLRRFVVKLDQEYARRFPRSRAWYENGGSRLLDGTSHAIRWNEPFMPVTRRAEGPIIEDLDGHRIIDYWQGHFANVLGHNPEVIRRALVEALEDGRGLQSGMVHEVEGEVCDLIGRATGAEKVRLTTSGSLGTFYAAMLARAFTGRDRVLKVVGGWHGSQPFGLKGVSVHGPSFDRIESEGLWAGAQEEIVLTRFNDLDDLRRTFASVGDRIACFLVEPVLGAGGGMVAAPEYLRGARALTEKHGALLLCDEIITAFRFRAGDATSLFGIRPDLLILGKILGGGMPVAAVAGRGDVLELCTRRNARVKFEGGTYSAHELSLVAARAQLRHLMENEDEIYARLATLGDRARECVRQAADEAGVPIVVTASPGGAIPGSSLVMWHATDGDAPTPSCPEDLAGHRHPAIDERRLKSVMLLEGVSVRSGLGAVSTAHGERELDASAEATRAALERFRRAGLV
jgi:glutamate-1-semialdehyde 2,1-aminomutase